MGCTSSKNSSPQPPFILQDIELKVKPLSKKFTVPPLPTSRPPPLTSCHMSPISRPPPYQQHHISNPNVPQAQQQQPDVAVVVYDDSKNNVNGKFNGDDFDLVTGVPVVQDQEMNETQDLAEMREYGKYLTTEIDRLQNLIEKNTNNDQTQSLMTEIERLQNLLNAQQKMMIDKNTDMDLANREMVEEITQLRDMLNKQKNVIDQLQMKIDQQPCTTETPMFNLHNQSYAIEYLDVDGWGSYDTHTAQIIFNKWKTGIEKSRPFTIRSSNNYTYIIDLIKMIQTNQQTGKTRQIRIITKGLCSQQSSRHMEQTVSFLNENKKWQNYDPSVSTKFFEKMHQGETQFILQINGKKYSIDLNRMTQMNIDTNFVRKIRIA